MSLSVPQALKRFFYSAQFPILFLGAGVSARAGLPSWKRLVEELAESLRSVDSLTAQLMNEQVAAGDFPLAVEYFRLSTKMVEGDKRKIMTRLLDDFKASAISCVAQLPVRACLTTNFDRSFLNAVASVRGTSPRDYRFGDTSFSQAQWEEDFFVARIHGAVEVPDRMVLSKSQFEALLEDETYFDLLRTCFVQRGVLFLGFSFYDPAIRFVFDELNRKFGPASPGRHMALLPNDANSDFLRKAGRLNIEVVSYDPANNHAELWDGIHRFNMDRPRGPSTPTVTAASPFVFTKRYLAACYARTQAQGSSGALRESVSEGLLSALLQEVSPKAITNAELLERFRIAVGIRGREAELLVHAAVKSLAGAGLCRKVKDASGRESLVVWTETTDDAPQLDSAIAVLAQSLKNRAYLQEAWKVSSNVDLAITSFFKQLIVRRGWDLGAAFASGRAPETVAIASLLTECSHGLPTFDLERLQRVCETMLQRPTDEEAAILRQLGRVSFALELAFQTPKTALLQAAILPRSLYFDASVLMPAIVDGHPYSKAYLQSIARLREASASGATELKTRVESIYLNEIITHRRNAQDYAGEFGNDFPDYARMDAIYHGVANVNVFVGAYANTYETTRTSFSEFLNRVAPYDSEASLKKWLALKGFDVVDFGKGSRHAEIYARLERAYANGLVRGKRPILIEHDAQQLSILDDQMRKGERSLFVTADRALHTAISEGPFANLTGMMLSHVALIQFIDLLLGGVTDTTGAAELLWSARISDRANAVRSYFTTRGLEQYDQAMAMEMPKIVEKFSEIAIRELDRQGGDLDSEDPKARAAAIRNLGGLEKNYLAGMREAVEKLRQRLGGD